MKEQLKLLWQLQNLEKEKKTLIAKKEKIKTDEVRRLWQEIRLMGQALVADRDKLLCMQKVVSRQEADLMEAVAQLKQLEDCLYNGEITSIKEMEQVKLKCDSLRHENEAKEGEVIRAMEECERLTNQIAEIEKQLQIKKNIHSMKQQGITQSIGQVEESLKEIDKRYHIEKEKIELSAYEQYTALAKKVIYPIAKVENGVCSGCRRGIPARQAASVASKPVYCDNCGRMLLSEG